MIKQFGVWQYGIKIHFNEMLFVDFIYIIYIRNWLYVTSLCDPMT